MILTKNKRHAQNSRQSRKNTLEEDTVVFFKKGTLTFFNNNVPMHARVRVILATATNNERMENLMQDEASK